MVKLLIILNKYLITLQLNIYLKLFTTFITYQL